MTTLAKGHCVPCDAGTPSMTIEQAREMLTQVPGWELEEKRVKDTATPMLVRPFRFKDFVQAIAFVNRVAQLAQAEGHHPDIHVSWNRVRLELTTHAIKGLSENDFIIAAKIGQVISHQ
jgi:4a-hydroxytetrahydrobiopterin dehydratase